MLPGQYANHNQVARGITGGTLTSDSTYYYRTFLSSATLSISKGQVSSNILIIGGGSGGQSGYGGSSGQAYTSSRNISKSKGNSIVTVGAGGFGITGATSTSITDQGSTTTANGASFYSSGNSYSAGAPSYSDPAGADAYPGGGGGSSNGANGYSYADQFGNSGAFGGSGGTGIFNPYSGPTSTLSPIAGGGGGAASDYWTGNVSSGPGYHGGGNGRSDGTGQPSIPATNALANSGAGGGGGSTSTGNSIGGSGILIIRYSKNGASG
jgi:hypothetical protein